MSFLDNATVESHDPVGLMSGYVEWFRVGQTREDRLFQAYDRTFFDCVCKCIVADDGGDPLEFCEWQEYAVVTHWAHAGNQKFTRDEIYSIPSWMISVEMNFQKWLLTPAWTQSPGEAPILMFTLNREKITYSNSRAGGISSSEEENDLRGTPPDPRDCMLEAHEGRLAYQDVIAQRFGFRRSRGVYEYD